VQRGYSISSSVPLALCSIYYCTASIVPQSMQDLNRPACWVGSISLGLTHCDRVFVFIGSLVTRWVVSGGFGASSGLWLANYFPSVLPSVQYSLLTCKTVSRITYTVLVETLNPAQSNVVVLFAGQFPCVQGSHSFTDKKSWTFQDPHEQFSRTVGACECLNIKKKRHLVTIFRV